MMMTMMKMMIIVIIIIIIIAIIIIIIIIITSLAAPIVQPRFSCFSVSLMMSAVSNSPRPPNGQVPKRAFGRPGSGTGLVL